MPLSTGVAGALALVVVGRRLDRAVSDLRKALRPLRVDRSRRTPGR